MILYKYFSPERITVLNDFIVRYTQPGEFNDPFEGLSMDATVTGQKTIRDGDNRDYGVLSMSEDPLSLLMWAHYTVAHTGFVIGFNTDHDYFGEREYSWLLRIDYREEYEPADLHHRLGYKSTHWQYEREWRHVINLPTYGSDLPREYYDPPDVPSALRTIDRPGQLPIYLYRIPPSAICEITIGCRTSVDLRRRVAAAVYDEPDLAHITIYDAVISRRRYELIRQPPHFFFDNRFRTVRPK